MKELKTGEQVKAECEAKGIILADIAREQGWRPQDVYKVLNGQSRARFGIGHEIAVYFGLKHGADDLPS